MDDKTSMRTTNYLSFVLSQGGKFLKVSSPSSVHYLLVNHHSPLSFPILFISVHSHSLTVSSSGSFRRDSSSLLHSLFRYTYGASSCRVRLDVSFTFPGLRPCTNRTDCYRSIGYNILPSSPYRNFCCHSLNCPPY